MSTLAGPEPSELLAMLSKIAVHDDAYVRGRKFGILDSEIRKMRMTLLAYLLGFMVGDAAKEKLQTGWSDVHRTSIN